MYTLCNNCLKHILWQRIENYINVWVYFLGLLFNFQEIRYVCVSVSHNFCMMVSCKWAQRSSCNLWFISKDLCFCSWVHRLINNFSCVFISIFQTNRNTPLTIQCFHSWWTWCPQLAGAACSSSVLDRKSSSFFT